MVFHNPIFIFARPMAPTVGVARFGRGKVSKGHVVASGVPISNRAERFSALSGVFGIIGARYRSGTTPLTPRCKCISWGALDGDQCYV